LGVWASRSPKSKGKLAFFRSVQFVKFKDVVVPGQVLEIEILIGEDNPRIEISGRPLDRLIQRIVGERIVALVDKKLKAEISAIELVVI